MTLPQVNLLDGIFWITALIIVWSVYRAHKDSTFREFNIFDVLMEGGRISRLACVFMGTWIVTSGLMIKLTVDGKMTEGYFGAYAAAWIAPIISKMFSSNSSTVATSSTTQTVEITK